VPCKSRALQMLGALNSRHSCQQCDHMSDLPQHSICTDGRKHADGMGSRGHGSSGWNIPASAGQLAYRKRAAKLIFGLSRYRGRAVLGGTRAVGDFKPGAMGIEIGRRLVRIRSDRGHLGRRINRPFMRPAPSPEWGPTVHCALHHQTSTERASGSAKKRAPHVPTVAPGVIQCD
jgi:hypothetical protein